MRLSEILYGEKEHHILVRRSDPLFTKSVMLYRYDSVSYSTPCSYTASDGVAYATAPHVPTQLVMV
jgi:hypothetical protein